jgi:hypothetical protein
MIEQPRTGDFPPEAAPPIEGEPLSEPANPVDADDQEGDIAAEHDDLTVGDQERGGPEGTAEDESPKGYGGGDLPA